MSEHNQLVNEMLDIRRRVSDAWARDLDAWSQDKKTLADTVRELDHRTNEVIELKKMNAAANTVGVRQIEEIEKLKTQLKQQHDDVVAFAGTDGETECFNYMELEAKAAAAREVYMQEVVPGPPPVSFEKLKPCCQIGWIKVVEFIESQRHHDHKM